MALNPSYIVSINLQEYLVDKDTGLPLSNGYIEFFQDSSRTTPKLVYQLTGSPPNYTYSALPNPVRLSAVGVPTNSDGDQVHIYYYPYDDDGEIQLYYVVVYNEDEVLQYTLEAWPNITAEDNPADQNNNVSNQISNSQFSQVNFIPNEGLVIEFDVALEEEVYQIAPDWEVIITSSGSGSLTIQQVALEGSLNINTNPPYKLTFSPSGVNITNLILRQVFNNNPDIWSQTTDGGGYISGIMLIESLDGQAHTIEMQYVQSGGPSSPQTIVSGSTLTSGYQLLNETVLLNAGTNTEDANEGAIFIDILLPNTGFYSITSIQVVGLNDENTLVNYEQESVNRQIDHLSHYYKPGWDFKPIKSYLVGWDFPLNPAQLSGTSVTLGAYSSNYLWDQTIGWQSINSSMAVTRATGSNYGCISIAALSTAKFAIIQYLTVPEIESLLKNELSSNIILSSNQASLRGTISLWYTQDLTAPNINNENLSLIATTNDDGKPLTFNGNWNEINRSNYGDAIFELSTSTDLENLQSFGFNGWQPDEDLNISLVTYFAIVVGFEELESGNDIVIKSCSLVPGSVPTIPAPQTFVEVLKDCQYYFNKTYPPSIAPGTPVHDGVVIYPLASYATWFNNVNTNFDIYANDFSYQFPVSMISEPIISAYSYLTGTIDNFVVESVYNNTSPTPSAGNNPKDKPFSTWFHNGTSGTNNTVAVGFTQNSSTSLMNFGTSDIRVGQTASGKFHFTFDSRIGVY